MSGVPVNLTDPEALLVEKQIDAYLRRDLKTVPPLTLGLGNNRVYSSFNIA